MPFQIFLCLSTLSWDCPWKSWAFSSHCLPALRSTPSFVVILYLMYRYQLYFSMFMAILIYHSWSCAWNLGHYSFFFIHTQNQVMITPGSGIKWITFRQHSLEIRGRSRAYCAASIFENVLLLETKVTWIIYLEILNWLEITAGNWGSSEPCESFMKLYLRDFFFVFADHWIVFYNFQNVSVGFILLIIGRVSFNAL